MIRKIFFLILSLNLILSNILFAGFTLLDKNRLIFSDGGGFEAITSTNTDGKTEKIIKALPYNQPGDTYRAKGINFIGPENSTNNPDKSIIYMISSDIFEKPKDVIAPTRYLVMADEANDNISSNGIPFNVNTDQAATGAGEILDIRDAYWVEEAVGVLSTDADPDNFHLVIGESAKNFITFGVDTSESRIISYNSDRNGDIQTFSMTPLRLNLSDKPLYVGRQDDPGGTNANANYDVPMLSLIPAYHLDGLSRIAVNTTRVIEKITIEGNFKVKGSLVTNGEFGVVEQEVAPSLSTVSAGQTITIACRPFTVKYVDHNFLFMGGMSGSAPGRAPTGVLWMELFYKSGGSWIPFNYAICSDPDDPGTCANPSNTYTIRQQSERKMEGSYAQDSFSMVSQYIQNRMPSHLGYLLQGNNLEPPNPVPIEDQTQVEYRVCLKFAGQGSGSITPSGDQNQILLMGLPAAKLNAAIPEIPPDEEADEFILEEVEFTAPNKPMLEKNGIILETDQGDIAGIATIGDFMVFTDGQDPATIRAPAVIADKILNKNVFKILNIHQHNIFTIQRDTTHALKFFIPKPDDDNPQGPYGQILNGTAVVKDESKTLTDHGIVSVGTLNLKSGLSIGSNQSIKLIGEADAIGDSPEGKLILDGVSESGYAISMPNDNVAFTGSYGGEVAAMYYGKCGSDEGKNLSTTGSLPVCYTSGDTLMDITFLTTKLKVENVSTIGAKLIILSSFSSKVQNQSGTYLSITLPQAYTATNINGEVCSTQICDTDHATFTGDQWANSAYSWSNIARLNKIKTYTSNYSTDETITVSLKHTGIAFHTDTAWASAPPVQGGNRCGNAGNVCKKSGSILVIGLFDKL